MEKSGEIVGKIDGKMCGEISEEISVKIGVKICGKIGGTALYFLSPLIIIVLRLLFFKYFLHFFR